MLQRLGGERVIPGKSQVEFIYFLVLAVIKLTQSIRDQLCKVNAIDWLQYQPMKQLKADQLRRI